MPPGGLGIRWPDQPLAQELRLQRYKVYAAMAYARANGLNRIVIDSPQARFGIITTGKSYLDVRQALDDLGIDEALASEIGLRILKVGMTWPLDAEGIRHFAEGLGGDPGRRGEAPGHRVPAQGTALQLARGCPPARDRQVRRGGRMGAARCRWLLPAAGELTPAMIARVIARRIARFHTSERIRERLDFLDAKEKALAVPGTGMVRVPHYCSGCPHNTSTKVPEGSRALAGIGCHYMALWLSPDTTQTFSQMGGEGVPWIGQAPFTEDAPRLRQSRRRHLLPFRLAGDPAGGRGRGQHHLQDPVQRRRRDDRRTTGRRNADGRRRSSGRSRRRASSGSSWSPTTRRSTRQRRHLRAAFRSGSGASWMRFSASCANFPAFPCWSTTRPAPPRSGAGASARPFPIRRSASSSTIGSARAAAIAAPSPTACRSCRSRRSSAASGDRPVLLQQGFHLPRGVLPELRDRRGRQTAPGQGAGS